MTTTCQFIVDRAKGQNLLNAPLVADTTDMLARIRAIQQRIFSSCAGITRDRFKTSVTGNSSSAASGRSLDLTQAAFSLPIERILQVKLASGVEVNQVDELDVEAELAPRYFPRGTSLYEVNGEWGPTGIVPLTVLYVYGATAISVTGNLSQNVSVPDEWTDTVVLPLAMYLHSKDPGRDPLEYERLEKLYTGTWTDFVGYLTNYSGNESRRFVMPAPPEIGKR